MNNGNEEIINEFKKALETNDTTPKSENKDASEKQSHTETKVTTEDAPAGDYIPFEESGTTDNSSNSSNGEEKDKVTNEEFIHILFDAGLLLFIFDMLMPGLMMKLVRKFGYEMDKKELKLTAAEKSRLEPYIQKWIDATNFKFLQPWQVALVAILSVYGGKILQSESLQKK